MVDHPGTFKVKVAADISPDSLFTEDDYPRYIVPLRVIRADKLPALLDRIKNTISVPFTFVSRYFMSGAIFADDVDEHDLPIKGEEVIATFEEKDGELLVTHISLIPRNELDYVNMEAINELYNLLKNKKDE